MFKKNELAIVHIPHNEYWHSTLVKLTRLDLNDGYLAEVVTGNGYGGANGFSIRSGDTTWLYLEHLVKC